ncbi:Gfo/Idh/MocA family oxidoreductase [Natrinema sp. DC36]|uniref:Gfo/Idh/MocA family protein n=1 Tax=Natrinema sp. DC36 TaxID=2878680 RepID=UPI001CF024D2|nr:Gfo/Idh/MocA family oxidoreductase [Natrinema sp. DC36]
MTGDSDAITVGVVGIGSLGRRLAEQFVELDGSELVALADVNEAALADVGEEFDVPETGQYTEYERMIEEGGLDAVGIATPNGLHYDQTLAALDADLHVLCEKPLATNVEDAYEVTRRAEESDDVVMVGYQRHFNPAYHMARERWALGDRDPRFITGEITHDWQSYYENMNDWRMDPELSGGGHLLNVGTHVIDAILWTTGLKPTEVNANVEFHDDEQIFDKQSTINIEFENGAMANVSDTGVVARTREHVHIWDEEGAVYLEGREWDDRTGYTIDDEGTERDPYFGYSRRLSKGSAFLESIVEGTDPPATVYDGLKAVVVTMAAYESGRREERVDIDEEFPFLDGVFE